MKKVISSITGSSCFGFNSLQDFSFADLAQNTEGFAFGSKGWLSFYIWDFFFFLLFRYFFLMFLLYEDPNFKWDNAGATLFGAAAPPAPKNNDEESDEEEAPNDLDIHFEPIVSLPEVQLQSWGQLIGGLLSHLEFEKDTLLILSPRWRQSPEKRTRKSFSRSAPGSIVGTGPSANGRSAAPVTSRSSFTQPNIPTASWWEESRCWEFVPITSSQGGWNSNPWPPQPTPSSGPPPTTQVDGLIM